MTDAKEMWNAIKSRFGGNDESKKMQKYILKQQFEGFSVSNTDGIHKGYENSKVYSFSIEIHGGGGGGEQVNGQSSDLRLVTTILESLKMDVKGSTAHHLPTCKSSIGFMKHQKMELKMASGNELPMRIKKFYNKLVRKLQFDAKEPVDRIRHGWLRSYWDVKSFVHSLRGSTGNLGGGMRFIKQPEVHEAEGGTVAMKNLQILIGWIWRCGRGRGTVAQILNMDECACISTRAWKSDGVDEMCKGVVNKTLIKVQGTKDKVNEDLKPSGSILAFALKWALILSDGCEKCPFAMVKIDEDVYVSQPARESSFDLESYSDSDYAGANLDRKSTTGGCQFLGRRLITWQCKKQTIVATSTTEAEYVAAASCCGQVLWIQNQMLDYGFNFMNTKIYIDNESTICIVKNPVYHSKTKHIAIRHHFIRDAYEKKLIQIAQDVRARIQSKNSLVKHFEDMRLCRPSKEYSQ
ncbi:hypothetical protein Tco_1017154, partial [Tanacetum coccineum]